MSNATRSVMINNPYHYTDAGISLVSMADQESDSEWTPTAALMTAVLPFVFGIVFGELNGDFELVIAGIGITTMDNVATGLIGLSVLFVVYAVVLFITR